MSMSRAALIGFLSLIVKYFEPSFLIGYKTLVLGGCLIFWIPTLAMVFV